MIFGKIAKAKPVVFHNPTGFYKMKLCNMRRATGGSILNHADCFDYLLRQGSVVGVGLGGRDGIHHIHALDHAAEGSLLSVLVGSILIHDEELR